MISVVVPHYEKQSAFNVTWKHLSPQLLEGDEVILVDDNSPSGLPNIDDDRIKITQLTPRDPHIYRLCTLRNKGVKRAANDAVVILDPDCIPNPQFIENAKKVFDPEVLHGGFIDYLSPSGEIAKPDPRAKNNRESRYTDSRIRGCAEIWGGCMLFSKERTRLSGWFNEEFNGHWGAEEHDFAARCYHSGMRLRHEEGLLVQHQYHKRIYRKKHANRNKKIWRKNMKIYASSLDEVTDYSPKRVLQVVIDSVTRLDERMENIFRETSPVKVALTFIGKPSEEEWRAIQRWEPRWAVDYRHIHSEDALRKHLKKTGKLYYKQGYTEVVIDG